MSKTIVFANTKGGVGKTTASLLLATELAPFFKICVIDADKNEHIVYWSKLGGVAPNLKIIGDITEDNISEIIEQAKKDNDLVIVDLGGAASVKMIYAIQEADLTIIPSGALQYDAIEVQKVVKLIQKQSRNLKSELPYKVLFTKTGVAIKTRDLKHLRESFKDKEIPMFKVELNQRVAFAALSSYGCVLGKLEHAEVNGVEKAIFNARAYVVEVLETIKLPTPIFVENIIDIKKVI